MSKWRVDWKGEHEPEPGQLVRFVTPTGKASYHRVTGVRVVMNRNPLPEGVTCRYAVKSIRLDGKPLSELASWTCFSYSKPKTMPKDLDAEIWG